MSTMDDDNDQILRDAMNELTNAPANWAKARHFIRTSGVALRASFMMLDPDDVVAKELESNYTVIADVLQWMHGRELRAKVVADALVASGQELPAKSSAQVVH